MKLAFRYMLLAALATWSGLLPAQTAALKGYLTDQITGEPVAMAHLVLSPLGAGSVSDFEGYYELADIPTGVYRLEVSSMGYQKLAIDSLLLEPGREYTFDWQLATNVETASEIVVTATRTGQRLALVPATVSVIKRAEIQSQNLFTFDQTLDATSGVQITRSNGSNIQALSIRGASEVAGGGIGNRVLLLVDGRPALSPESGGALWNLVPLQSVERIEVVKGAYSSLFGSSAMGGVVNVITRTPAAGGYTTGHVSGGMYNRAPAYTGYDAVGRYYTAEMSHGRSVGSWQYLIDAGHKMNEGHRQKSAFEISHLFGKAVYMPNNRDKWTLSGNLNRIFNDTPASWLNTRRAYQVAEHRLDDFQRRLEFVGDLAYESVRSAELKYSGRAYHYQMHARYTFNDNPEDKSPGNVNFGKQTLDATSVLATRSGAAFQADYYRGAHTWIAGVDVKQDFVDGRPDTVLYGRHHSLSAGVYLQDEIHLSNTIIGTLGIRYDYFWLSSAFDESNFSPKASLVWETNNRLSFRAMFAQAFRNPSMAERFIKFTEGGGLSFEPNPTLRAERLTASVELGSQWRPTLRWFVDGALFYNRYRDLITYQQLPDRSGRLLYQVVNLNMAVMQGAEVNVRYQIPRRLSAGVAYTFLDARNTTVGRIDDDLPYKARHMINGNLGLEHKGFKINYVVRHRSAIRQVFLFPGSEPGAFVLHNVMVSRSFVNGWMAYAAIDNVDNTQYEEIERYRMPGRSYTLGLRFGI